MQIAAAIALCAGERKVKCIRCNVRVLAKSASWRYHLATRFCQAAATDAGAAAQPSSASDGVRVAGDKRAREISQAGIAEAGGPSRYAGGSRVGDDAGSAAIEPDDDPFAACNPDCGSRKMRSAFLCVNCS